MINSSVYVFSSRRVFYCGIFLVVLQYVNLPALHQSHSEQSLLRLRDDLRNLNVDRRLEFAWIIFWPLYLNHHEWKRKVIVRKIVRLSAASIQLCYGLHKHSGDAWPQASE